MVQKYPKPWSPCGTHDCFLHNESFVSRYENHFDARRSTNEETANEEFEIAANGRNLANCDGIVTEAMHNYWRSRGGHWHFFRVSVLDKLKVYDGGSVQGFIIELLTLKITSIS